MFSIKQLEMQLIEAVDERAKIELMNEIVFQLRHMNPRRSQELMERIDQLLLQNPDDVTGRVMTQINRSAQAAINGNYKLAIDNGIEILNWCREHHPPLFLVRLLGVMGLAYIFSGNQTQGLEALLEAVTLGEKLDYRLELSMSLMNLGAAHGMTERPEMMEQAWKLTERSLNICIDINDIFGIALAQYNQAQTALRLHNDPAAFQLAEESLTISRKNNNYYVGLLAVSCLANLYDYYGKTEQSDRYLAESMDFLDHYQALGGAGGAVTQYYYFAGKVAARRGEWQLAESLIRQSVENTNQDHSSVEYQSHQMLAEIYEREGDFARAFQYYKQFHVLKETFISQESEDKFKQISIKFQVQQTQLEADYHRRLHEEGQKHIQRQNILIDELQSFGYSVSHDLRAPLRSIMSFSQILLEDHRGQLDVVGIDYLNRIFRAGERMSELIESLLRLSRITQSNIEVTTVNLSLLSEDILSRLSQTQTNRLIDWIVEPAIVVQGDEGMLRAMMENLLNNAWKYSSTRVHAHIEVGCYQQNNERIIYVRDNGVGFDMAYASRLFSVFQRLHNSEEFEGNGVGLATVKRIVQRHGGRIWVESVIDQGATFYFLLGTPESISQNIDLSDASKHVQFG